MKPVPLLASSSFCFRGTSYRTEGLVYCTVMDLLTHSLLVLSLRVHSTHTLQIRADAALKYLGFTVAGLATAHVVVHSIRSWIHPGHPLGYEHPFFGIHRFFDLGQEANLPTLIAALLLLAAGGLLALTALNARRVRGGLVSYWAVLAAGFVLMGIDEAAQIHEGLVGHALDHVAGQYYMWPVVFVPVVLIVAAAYARFLLRIDRQTAKLLTLSGVIYVGGAVGVELVESVLWSRGVGPSLLAISRLVEESAELAGVVLLIYTLLSRMGGLQLTLQPMRRSQGSKPGEPLARPTPERRSVPPLADVASGAAAS